MSKSVKLKGLDRRFDVETPNSIDTDVLDTFQYKYTGKDIIVNIDTDEFTTVCPYSGLPDFAIIKINYIPKKNCIELRSLKYYLLSYRNVGIYQEHAVNQILRDLIKCCKPKWMEVIADYKTRGGIHTVTKAQWGKKQKNCCCDSCSCCHN